MHYYFDHLEFKTITEPVELPLDGDELHTDPNVSQWWGPRSAFARGWIDLTVGAPTSAAPGLIFMATTQRDDAPDRTYLGEGLNSAFIPSRNALDGLLGLRLGSIVSNTIEDLLAELLMSHADPNIPSRWGPLMPTADRKMIIALPGHSVNGGRSWILSEEFDSIAHPQVVTQVQKNYRAYRQECLAGVVLNRAPDPQNGYKRYLDKQAEKLRLPYQQLIPPGLPDEGTLPHRTTFTDDFNRGDNTDIGSNWTEVDGDMEIDNNQLQGVSGAAANPTIRHTSDHDGDDIITLMTCADHPNGDEHFECMRFSSSAKTTYAYRARRGTTNTHHIRKFVTGTETELANENANVDISNNGVRSFGSANGSLIEGGNDISGAETVLVDVTDTAIASGLRGGHIGGPFGGDTHEWDDYESRDIAAAGLTTGEIVAAAASSYMAGVPPAPIAMTGY